MIAKNIIIKKQTILEDKECSDSELIIPNARTMDIFTQKIILTAHKLFDGKFDGVNRNCIGIALCTQTGPAASLKKIADIINTHTYKGINPSLFPNVMLSTAVSYLAMHLKIHGPTCVFYDSDPEGKDTMDYCEVQITEGHCDAMIMICINENAKSSGKYIVRKDI